MRLLLIRHAIAEDRDEFRRTGQDDHRRPLTAEGRKKMKQGARGLRALVPAIDLLATSPLTRAAQTGAILDAIYGGLKVLETRKLSPETAPADSLRWLRRRPEKTIAAVGHEPALGLLLSRLLTGGERPVFAFRKGGACLLDVPDDGQGTATLVWALTPAQLRQLAE